MTENSDTAPDPPASGAPQPDEDPPADDTFLMGVSGVEEQVLAELARAGAQLESGEAPDGDDAGAVV